MPVQHLPADSPSEKLSEVLERDGCLVIDRVLSRATLDRLTSEMEPHVEATPHGQDEFDGFKTRRTGMLVARSPTSHEIIMNRSVLAVRPEFERKTSGFAPEDVARAAGVQTHDAN